MENHEVDQTGKYAAILSMTEVGLGSLLHAWRVPFAGHFLSLNQGFLLAKASQGSVENSGSLGFRVSMIAALLKSLSPAGKRLTPMLGISTQGLLFSMGQFIFGNRLFGTWVSLVLLSLWAFLQPILIYLLVFGRSIVDVGIYYFEKLQQILPISYDHLAFGVMGLVTLKVLLASIVAFLAHSKTEEEVELYFKKLTQNFKVPLSNSAPETLHLKEKFGLVLKDFLQPWFVVSMVLLVVFFWVSQPKGVAWVWVLLRPLAGAFIVFYALRFLPLDRWILRFSGSQKGGLYRSMETALLYIKGKKSL